MAGQLAVSAGRTMRAKSIKGSLTNSGWPLDYVKQWLGEEGHLKQMAIVRNFFRHCTLEWSRALTNPAKGWSSE